MIPGSAGARELPIGTEASWLFASVLAAFAGLAMLLAKRLGMPHGYWMTLTILSVLQPDVYVTKARTSARAVGSVAGSLAALAVAVGFHDHDLPVLIGIIVACVATVLVTSYQWKVALYTMIVSQAGHGEPGAASPSSSSGSSASGSRSSSVIPWSS